MNKVLEALIIIGILVVACATPYYLVNMAKDRDFANLASERSQACVPVDHENQC